VGSDATDQLGCFALGKNISEGRTHCAQCSIEGATQRLANAARLGRVAAQTPEDLAKQADSQRRHSSARSSWNPPNQPVWLTAEAFSQRIQPLLAGVSTSVIRSQIGVSRWYASRIRVGLPTASEALGDLGWTGWYFRKTRVGVRKCGG
jgi:hypothetical protein